MSEATDLIDAQIAAYRDKDLERFLSYYAPDVTIRGGDGQVMMADREVMREQYTELFRASPDLAVDIVSRIAVGNIVVDEEHLQNFHMPGLPADLTAIVAYRVTDGKISQVYLLS
jgi:hypothetical protein